jgi:transposase
MLHHILQTIAPTTEQTIRRTGQLGNRSKAWGSRTAYVLDGMVVVEGRRRRVWPEEVKRRIVEESCDPDVTVCEVARRHDLEPAQLYSWRKLFRQEIDREMPFLPVQVAEPTVSEDGEPKPTATLSTPDRIEVSFPDGCRLSLPAETPVKKVAALMKAMRS